MGWSGFSLKNEGLRLETAEPPVSLDEKGASWTGTRRLTPTVIDQSIQDCRAKGFYRLNQKDWLK